MLNREALLRHQGAAPGRRRRRVRGARRLSPGHGPARDRLEDSRPATPRLIAKEYRTERNNNIVMALDAGRAMCEPLAGVPRDRPRGLGGPAHRLVALKDGDRVGLFAFDSQAARVEPADRAARAPSRLLQRVAAGIDYSASETNYTLGMATLAERPQPPLADRHLHRIRRHDQRRADAGRGRHPAEAPPRPVRRAAGRGAGGLRRRRAGRARGRQPRGHRRRACCASAGW